MRRLVKTISVIMMLFIVSSICIYRLRLRDTLLQQDSGRSATAVVNEIQTAEGDINSVDAVNNTLLMSDGRRVFVFSFNNKTVFRNADRTVQPATISSGTRARVRYRQRGNRNVAQEILIAQPN